MVVHELYGSDEVRDAVTERTAELFACVRLLDPDAEIDVCMDDGLLVAAVHFDGVPEPVQEHRAVGQSGQLVVEGLVLVELGRRADM